MIWTVLHYSNPVVSRFSKENSVSSCMCDNITTRNSSWINPKGRVRIGLNLICYYESNINCQTSESLVSRCKIELSFCCLSHNVSLPRYSALCNEITESMITNLALSSSTYFDRFLTINSR